MKSNDFAHLLNAQRQFKSGHSALPAPGPFAHLATGGELSADGLTPVAAAIINLGEKYRPASPEARR